MSIIIPANSAVGGGYDVDNSLRFNRASSDYLNRTPSSEGNKRTMTFSFWLKRTQITAESYFIYSAGADASNRDAIMFANQSLRVISQRNESNYWVRNTTRLFRDSSAWSHIVIAIDTTQGTDSNRIKIYINGVQETAFETYAWGSAYPSQNFDTYFNDDISQAIGSYSQSSGNHYDGYISEFVMIDGTALDATSFGEFDEDSGIWKPINVSGLTFGTNGFYQEYKQSGTGTNSSGMGADTSGNDNNFAVNNLTAVDQSTDTCTNNFCTANPLQTGSGSVSNAPLSDGNLTFTSSQAGSPYPYYFSTFAASQGKWYAEFKVTTANSAVIGIGTGAATGFLGAGLYDYSYYYDGTFYNNGGNTGSQSSYTDGDIISVAMDLDNNKIYVAKNNTWQHSGNPSGNSGGYTIVAPASQTGNTATGVYHIAYGDAGGGTPAIQGNFGSPPYAISSGNADADDYGNFEYAVPSGYFALCTKNLAEYG